jgi:hypothetical protein
MFAGTAEFGAAGTAGAAPVVLGAAGAGRTEGLPCISEAEPPCAWAKAAARIAAHTIKATDVFRISCFPFFTCSLTPTRREGFSIYRQVSSRCSLPRAKGFGSNLPRRVHEPPAARKVGTEIFATTVNSIAHGDVAN